MKAEKICQTLSDIDVLLLFWVVYEGLESSNKTCAVRRQSKYIQYFVSLEFSTWSCYLCVCSAWDKQAEVLGHCVQPNANLSDTCTSLLGHHSLNLVWVFYTNNKFGYYIWPKWKMLGQTPILVGKCLMFDCYFKHCVYMKCKCWWSGQICSI